MSPAQPFRLAPLQRPASQPPIDIAMSTAKPQASKLKDSSSSSMDADEKDEGVASPNEVAQERANDAATGLSGEGAQTGAAEGDEQAPLARFGFDSQQHTSRQRAASAAQGTVQRKEWRSEGQRAHPNSPLTRHAPLLRFSRLCLLQFWPTSRPHSCRTVCDMETTSDTGKKRRRCSDAAG